MDRDFLTLRQAATYLGISIHTMRHYASDRVFPLYRCGGKLLFVEKAELDKWRLSHRIEPSFKFKMAEPKTRSLKWGI